MVKERVLPKCVVLESFVSAEHSGSVACVVESLRYLNNISALYNIIISAETLT